ncbi:MAG: hypothetical protein ABSF90_10575 [Syntrophobacteraceae bacterium]|jgi:hypothetical protein
MTTLNGITLTAGDKTQAESIGADITGLMAEAATKCQELIDLLTFIKTDILTPASDSSNASTFATEITALS